MANLIARRHARPEGAAVVVFTANEVGVGYLGRTAELR